MRRIEYFIHMNEYVDYECEIVIEYTIYIYLLLCNNNFNSGYKQIIIFDKIII